MPMRTTTRFCRAIFKYDSPLEVVVSHDGARLYVLCQQSETVRVFDAASYAPIKTIPVGRVPRGMALSASGDRLYVTNSWEDTLSVIDTQTLAVVATWNVGAEPSGVVADRAGERIFVANRISNDVAVLDAHTAWRRNACWRTRGKLPYYVARREPDLLHARLSKSITASHRA